MLASILVVVAHCVHVWVEGFAVHREFLSLSFLSAVLDQLTRFTVPLFFFLSGFGLTLQLRDGPLRLREYYRYRLSKILAPFLIWSLLTAFRHQEFILGMPWASDPRAAGLLFLRFLLLDGFDYQYYFVIVIFQFYLVYPLLYKLGRSRLFMALFLVLHLALMSPVETYLQLAGIQLPNIHPNLLAFHWLYCFAGMHAAWNKDFLIGSVGRWSGRKIVGFWLATLALMIGEFLGNIWNEKGLSDTDHFNRWSVVLYCLSSLILFMKYKSILAARVYDSPFGRFLFSHVAPFTFFVYLAHTHVLRLVDYLLWEVTIFDYLNRILLVVAGSYLLAWTTQWLLEDFPRLRFYLGLPKKPIVDWSRVPGARLFRLRVAQTGRDSGRAASMQAGPMAGHPAQSGQAALSRRLSSDHPAV
ncbi:MAG: acyltransferase [Fibrobacteres bacterium]|nr:acyltransferase [Fibrobacterota bacterium]